jgi:hypothetical protein
MLMKSAGGCLIILAILLILFALSLGGAAAAPAGVGADIVKIISVSYQDADQWVEIANMGSGLMNLDGWSLKNRENQSYAFPANFTLKAGSTARVHSKEGSNSSSDLYNSALFWSEMGDTATLEDIAGRIISQYRYPIEVSTPGSASDNKPLSLPNAFSSGGMNPPFLPAYRPPPGKEMSSLRSSSSTLVNLTGHTFICHGGPLNWAWTTGLG